MAIPYKRRIMKKSLLLILIITLMCPASVWARSDVITPKVPQYYKVTAQTKPMSLADCYAHSLVQSELVAIDSWRIVEAEGRFLQALAIALPHISFISTDTQEDPPKNGIIAAASAAAVSTSQLNPNKDSIRRFNVTQTLFNGFKAIAAMKGSKLEKNQRIAEKIRGEQLLLVDVANAFYLVVEKREDIKTLIGIRYALQSRIKELRDREQLGRSRPSEVVNAKTSLYSVEAELEVSRNQEVVARQLLEFLTGVPVGRLIDTNVVPDKLDPETYYLNKSLGRPDVVATRDGWEVSKRKLEIIDSDFLPEAHFEGNWYTQRTDVQKGIDWDVMLKVTVPIFEGTDTLGRDKEARAQVKESELLYKRSLRTAPQDVSQAYTSLNTAISIQHTLKKAYSTAKLNYYLQRKDYSLSLVSNLDVLDSIKTLHDSERDYIHSIYEAKRLFWQLLVACGETLSEHINDTF
jgi:outer membrane protein